MATVRFRVVPNAKIEKVIGDHDGAIKVKLRATAVEGKANAALRCFLAEKLNVPQHAIVLERGSTSRNKAIRIDGLNEASIRRRLLS